MYIDRHEWNKVVEYRELYLRILKVILFAHAPPSFCQDEQPVEYFIEPQHKSAALFFHYESTYHSNEDQGWM